MPTFIDSIAKPHTKADQSVDSAAVPVARNILLPDSTRIDAERIGERVRRAVSEARVDIGCESVGITVSIGVAQFFEDGEETDRVLQIADQHLYRAKEAGRNRVCA